MDVAACVWRPRGEVVTETRVGWLEPYPDGVCEPVVQTRTCICGIVCEDYLPVASATCTSGCGFLPHHSVEWTEERRRYAQPLSHDVCFSQLQKRGLICQGVYGGTTNASLVPMTTWCVPLDRVCSTIASLFLFESCDVITLSASPTAPPGMLTREYDTLGTDDTVFVGLIIGAGITLVALLLLVGSCWYERNRLQRALA